MLVVEHRRGAPREGELEGRQSPAEPIPAPGPAPVSPTEARLPYRPSLDGLRGLAVAAVVGYHLGLSWLVGGFLGVSLFFTLSGFLIANLLLSERGRTGTVSLRQFWGRRARRRLLPAALAGIALAILAAAVAGTADQLRQLPGDVIGAVSYNANWRFVLDHSSYGAGYQAPSPLLHYWSLAIEEQAYLFLPLLVLVVARGRSSRRRLGAAVVGLMATSAVLTLAVGAASDSNRVYFGTDTRSFELLAGVLLAVVVGMRRPARVPGWVPVGGLLVMVGLWGTVAETDHWLYRGGFWLVAAISCSVIVGATGTGLVARLLAWPPLVQLGRRSYGICVYHWPLFVLLDPSTTGLTGIGLVAIRLGATAAVAGASYRWFEQPIRERRWRLTRPRLAGCVLAPVAVVVAALQVAGIASGRAVAGVAARPIVLSSTTPSKPAADPAVAPLQRVLFVGDSLMQQAYPTFAARLGAQGVVSDSIGHPGESLWSKAGTWLPALRQSVATFDPDVVVLESCCGHFAFDPAWVGPSGHAEDPQDPAFYDEWRQLATQASEIASARGAVVMWVLAPPTRTNGFYGPIDGQIPVINAMYQAITACDPGMGTVDWGAISGPGGAYAASLPDSTGRLVTVRDADGFHFTAAGWDVQAQITLAGIRGRWATDGGRVQPWNGTCV